MTAAYNREQIISIYDRVGKNGSSDIDFDNFRKKILDGEELSDNYIRSLKKLEKSFNIRNKIFSKVKDERIDAVTLSVLYSNPNEIMELISDIFPRLCDNYSSIETLQRQFDQLDELQSNTFSNYYFAKKIGEFSKLQMMKLGLIFQAYPEANRGELFAELDTRSGMFPASTSEEFEYAIKVATNSFSAKSFEILIFSQLQVGVSSQELLEKISDWEETYLMK